MFSYQFLSAAPSVSDYKTLAVESAATVFSAAIPQLNKVFKAITHRPVIPSLFVLRKAGEDIVESSVAEFISNEKEEFLFGYIDIVNFGGLTGFHTNSILALFALLLQDGKVNPKRLARVQLILFKDFMVYNLERNYAFKNSQVWTVDLSEVKLASKVCQPRKLM